jgi:hypothetical protein
MIFSHVQKDGGLLEEVFTEFWEEKNDLRNILLKSLIENIENYIFGQDVNTCLEFHVQFLRRLN